MHSDLNLSIRLQGSALHLKKSSVKEKSRPPMCFTELLRHLQKNNKGFTFNLLGAVKSSVFSCFTLQWTAIVIYFCLPEVVK